MGIQTSIITFKGKIGSLRGSSWKGKKTVAQQPTSYNDANTSVQQANRRKFTLVQERARKMLPAIKLGFKKAAVGKTEANVFTQLNLPFATDNGSEAALPWADMIVSKGNVLGFQDLATDVGTNPGDIKYTWVDNSDGTSGDPTDLVCQCDVCFQEWTFTFTVTNKTRADEALEVSRGAEHAGHEFASFLFFKKAGTNDVSDSSYKLATAES